MSFNINQNFDLKSPQFNFARDYYKDIATLKAESEDNFPDHFITNVAGTLYQLTKSNSVDATTGKWRELKFGLTGTEIDSKGYATKTELKDVVNHIIVGASVNNESGDTDIAVKNNEKGCSLDAVIPVVSDKLNGVMTPAQKTKLAGIAEGANKTVVDSKLLSSSDNPVSAKGIAAALQDIIDNNIGPVENKVEAVGKQVTTLEGKVTNNTESITNLGNSFKTFKGSVTSIEVCDTATIDAMFV